MAHSVPVPFAFFWGLQTDFQICSRPLTELCEGFEYSAAPASLPLELTSPALLSPVVYTHQYCSQPSPKLSYLAHKPHFRVDTARCGDYMELSSSLPQGEVSNLWQAPSSSYQPAPNQSSLGKVTGHSLSKSKLDNPIQALSCPAANGS